MSSPGAAPPSSDLGALAAVHGHQQHRAVVHRLEAPLLVGLAVAAVLLQPGTVVAAAPLDVEALVVRGVGQRHRVRAERVDHPLLLRSAAARGELGAGRLMATVQAEAESRAGALEHPRGRRAVGLGGGGWPLGGRRAPPWRAAVPSSVGLGSTGVGMPATAPGTASGRRRRARRWRRAPRPASRPARPPTRPGAADRAAARLAGCRTRCPPHPSPSSGILTHPSRRRPTTPTVRQETRKALGGCPTMVTGGA